MQLRSIAESLSEGVRYVYWTEDDFDSDAGYDTWVAADQADAIAKKSNIRISSDKNLAWIAIDKNDDVVGAIWTSLSRDRPPEYDFDVAVDPEWRGGNIGLKLIELVLDDFRSLDLDDVYIRVWVINPKLVRVLERRYGFEIESQYRDGSAHMLLSK